ncbi:hypothetical protein BDB01DRAFT_816199 [Pilobolus umbonatus]|nr:hypothetical protein BDB01DRAFT_816199 [Pilobolus umbonatus]
MFSKSNPFDECVTAATNENLTGENWELILAVTDKVTRASPDSARDCVAAVEKRVNNKIPNVQLYAISLAEALVKNCDINLHREISSRYFTNTLSKLVHERSVHPKVKLRILEFIQMCSFEFRADSTLGLMNEVYQSLRAEGIQFPSPQKPKKEFTQSELDKQKEEEEFQLALALSLSESENQSKYRSTRTTAATTTTTITTAPKPAEEETPQISRVRALYDFQPTEQGELGFEKGDIIRVIESVYRDWWKGELRGKTGIFPVNYVEKIVDPSPSDLLKEASIENEVVNESQNIDRLLEILSSNDGRLKETFSENDELQTLYNRTLAIRPKLVKLIEKYSLKKDELVALNEKFMHARSIYDGMLSSSVAKYANPASSSVPYGYPGPAQSPYVKDAQPIYNNYTGYPPYNNSTSTSQPPNPPTNVQPTQPSNVQPPPSYNYSSPPPPQAEAGQYPYPDTNYYPDPNYNPQQYNYNVPDIHPQSDHPPTNNNQYHPTF